MRAGMYLMALQSLVVVVVVSPSRLVVVVV